MGGVVGVELGELVDELSKSPLQFFLKPPAPPMCLILARRSHRKKVHEEVAGPPDAVVFDARRGF